MEESWKNVRIEGWAGFVLFKKLNHVKSRLMIWNRDVFGVVKDKLKKVELELHHLDIQAEAGVLQVVDFERRKVLKAEMWRLMRLNEWMWLQKSRITWAKKGDLNTRFFHLVANGRQRRNLLHSVTVDERVFDKPGEMKFHVRNHFREVFTESWIFRPVFESGLGARIDQMDKKMLIEIFSEQEVWDAIKEWEQGSRA